MLTQEEIDFLDANGYLNLGQLLSPTQVERINLRISEIQEKEGENAGAELADSKYIRHPKEEGADRLADLVNKGQVFDIFYTHPRVLAGIEAVLGKEYRHGGTTNFTDKDRRSIHSYFCTRDQPQQIDQKRYIKQETVNRVGEIGKHVLDV